MVVFTFLMELLVLMNIEVLSDIFMEITLYNFIVMLLRDFASEHQDKYNLVMDLFLIMSIV